MSDCTTNHARLVRLALLVMLLGGCASRHVAAVPPGHDAQHPALTPVGKGLCRAGVLKVFGSYGWRNCKNEEPKPEVKPATIDVRYGQLGEKP